MLSLLFIPLPQPDQNKLGVTPPKLTALPTDTTKTELFGMLPDNNKSQLDVALPLL
jgi:hypothetical protein